jgi:hypothetical protein
MPRLASSPTPENVSVGNGHRVEVSISETEHPRSHALTAVWWPSFPSGSLESISGVDSAQMVVD